MSIQFSVLSRALRCDPPSALAAPVNHSYQTFKQGLPLQLPTQESCAVGLNPAQLVNPDSPASARRTPFSFSCPFCRLVLSWRMIDRFWSHLELCYDKVPSKARLAEVKRQTAGHLASIRERNKESNYRHSNVTQWNMIQQAQAPNFDWHTFTLWTLRSDMANKPPQISPPAMSTAW